MANIVRAWRRSRRCARAGPCLSHSCFLVTQRLQILDGYSPIQAGLCTAPLAIGLIGGGPLLTWGSQRLGAPRTAALGLLIGGAGLAGLAIGLGHGIVPLGAGLLALGAAV